MSRFHKRWIELAEWLLPYQEELHSIELGRLCEFTSQLSAFGFRDHSGELPHLLHSANCTQVDLVLDKLKTNSSFSNSRFALQLLIASNDKANATATIVLRKSLDDEHSPGVFTVRMFSVFCKTWCWQGYGISLTRWRTVWLLWFVCSLLGTFATTVCSTYCI